MDLLMWSDLQGYLKWKQEGGGQSARLLPSTNGKGQCFPRKNGGGGGREPLFLLLIVLTIHVIYLFKKIKLVLSL